MAPWITFRRFAQGTSIPCAPSRPKPLRGSLGAASASATNRCEACGACSHTRSVIRRFTLSGWRTSTQVENWFSKVQRHVIARGVFESVADLRRNSCAISKPTIRLPLPFNGLTRTQPIESQRSCFI